MACSKFEESGLLYCSDELDEHEIRQYQHHLEQCQECRQEVQAYKQEQSSFYTPEILGETPSEAVNREILRVCASAKKQHTSSFMPFFLKKTTVMSLLFFAVGFATVGYVMFNVDRAESIRARLTTPQSSPLPSPQVASESSSSSVALSQTDSSQFDSLRDSTSAFSQNRGNLNSEGVITVDLKE